MITNVVLDNGLIVSASADGSIMAWSQESLTSVYAIKTAHEYSVTSLDVKRGLIISGGSGDGARIWGLHNGSFVRAVSQDRSVVFAARFLDDLAPEVFVLCIDDEDGSAKVELFKLS